MSSRADSSQPLPASLCGRPFTTALARSHGLSRSRTRARDFIRPFRGVIAPSSLGSRPAAMAVAYAAKMPSTHCFSHSTAAILHGMRLPRATQELSELHVTAGPDSWAPQGKRIRGHVGEVRVVELGGLRVVPAIVAWCQLSTLLGLDDLVIAADGLVARKNPTATVGELQAAVESWRGRRGFRRLSDALAHVRERTDSARETMLRLLIVRAGMPEPMINAPIRSRTGHVVAHADLAYPEFNLILEYDGDHHRTERAQYYTDIDRLERITREGWRVIRINLKHMANPAALEAVIRQALADAGRA
ncbi:MAG: hypothetical protein JJE28_08490 [Actinomycetales bacterium]|nr:hypothetical protein [Actinomycetales bacterium]